MQTEAGVASFTALVDALKTGSGTLILYAFDLLHLDGYDLRAAPLKDRKAALAKVIAAHGDTSRIRYSDHIEGEGDAVFRARRPAGPGRHRLQAGCPRPTSRGAATPGSRSRPPSAASS